MKKEQKKNINLRLCIFLFAIAFIIILLSPNPFGLIEVFISGFICIIALLFGIKSVSRTKKKMGIIFLLLVIILWGLLVYSRFEEKSQQMNRARTAKTEADIAAFETALQMYKEDWGNYPSSLFPYLLEENKGPYIKGVVTDPWGNEYIYIYPGLHIQDGFDLFSKGKDKASNILDDINNWDKEKSWREEY